MRISVVVPIHNMMNRDFFLNRCLESVKRQTFKDYEVVVVEEGKFGENVNAGIRKAKGELIKFLLMDDWLDNENSLQRIADTFTTGWLITGCSNNPHPYWTEDIWSGNNKLGSPSCLTVENELKEPSYFDETLSWMVDIEYYMRLYKRYGKPKILDEVNVNIGIGEHQMTHLLSDETKNKEQLMMKEKYA